jgi:hypothetical protein
VDLNGCIVEHFLRYNIMNNICRFCLTVSTQEMEMLCEKSDLMNKIRTSLLLQVSYYSKLGLTLILRRVNIFTLKLIKQTFQTVYCVTLVSE